MYKMNKIVNKFLLVGDKFKPEMYLKQPGFTYSACGLFTKTKDLVKRTQSDKALKDKAFKIASDPKYDGYQRGLASMVYKFFDKKSKGSGIINEPNYQLANELHKPIIRKFKKRKVYSSFRDNIWGVDLADMQSLSKYNKAIKYLLCAIDFFSKYAWVIS